jgi:HK97 gp10 family phage protein
MPVKLIPRTGHRPSFARRRQAALEALGEGGEQVAQEARRRVLDLRAANRPLPSKLARSIAAVPAGPDGEAVRVLAGAPYARFVEFGTRRRAARSFLGAALAELKPAVTALVRRAFGADR